MEMMERRRAFSPFLQRFTLAFLAFFLLFLGFAPSVEANKHNVNVYIVYRGHHNELKTVDEIREVHHSLLLSVKESEEEARSSLIYSYKHSIDGFAALLTPDEAARLSETEDVVSTFPSQAKNMHTTRSWKFLVGEKSFSNVDGDHEWTSSSLLKKARHGEDVIVGLLDSGVWPESKSFSDKGMKPIPKRWKGICQEGEAFNSSHCNRIQNSMDRKVYDQLPPDLSVPAIFPLALAEDTLIWKDLRKDIMSTSQIWNYIRPKGEPEALLKDIWEGPPRQSWYLYLAYFHRWPTDDFLQKRGIKLASMCLFCNNSEETVDHISLNCKVVRKVWRHLSILCGLRHTPSGTIKTAFKIWINRSRGQTLLHKCRRILFTITIAALWSFRNRLRHQPNTRISSLEDFIVNRCSEFFLSMEGDVYSLTCVRFWLTVRCWIEDHMPLSVTHNTIQIVTWRQKQRVGIAALITLKDGSIPFAIVKWMHNSSFLSELWVLNFCLQQFEMSNDVFEIHGNSNYWLRCLRRAISRNTTLLDRFDHIKGRASCLKVLLKYPTMNTVGLFWLIDRDKDFMLWRNLPPQQEFWATINVAMVTSARVT